MKNNREKKEEEDEEERRVWKATRIDDRLADVFSNGYFDAFICSTDTSRLIVVV